MQIFTALEPISGQTAAHAKRLIQKGNSPPCRENGTRIFCYKYPFLLLQISPFGKLISFCVQDLNFLRWKKRGVGISIYKYS